MKTSIPKDKKPLSLTLGFSTVGQNLEQLSCLLHQVERVPNIEIVVVVQNWKVLDKQYAEKHPNIVWDWSSKTGLSRSRNRVVELAASDYVWMLDDDVEFGVEEINWLVGFLDQQASAADILRVRVGCTHDRTRLYKQYTDSNRVTKLTLLQMNSIELLFKRTFVVKHALRFNENIGLGTAYPGNEEVNFLLDAWRFSPTFKLIHRPLVFHSCFEGGRQKVESAAIMEIRGATASRFGLLGAILLIRWCGRYVTKYRSVVPAKALWRGYLNGYRTYC
ncbi:glycosyltransferase family 2 protein [Aestuariibacter halophilus]|uniref:Glycosyltransferase family 2 protein n=1 Tax=Fluctibacter halophilus TaxID=226011 RepID=A0ABS8G2V1_9ALTE|nr:glycosyltransferase family A protein [Aestuariibacter halophilus]MCC2614824.1 glycosyltransferase family 2 protein [Aestuariibacter halophilus]